MDLVLYICPVLLVMRRTTGSVPGDSGGGAWTPTGIKAPPPVSQGPRQLCLLGSCRVLVCSSAHTQAHVARTPWFTCTEPSATATKQCLPCLLGANCWSVWVSSPCGPSSSMVSCQPPAGLAGPSSLGDFLPDPTVSETCLPAPSLGPFSGKGLVDGQYPKIDSPLTSLSQAVWQGCHPNQMIEREARREGHRQNVT